MLDGGVITTSGPGMLLKAAAWCCLLIKWLWLLLFLSVEVVVEVGEETTELLL